MTSTLTPPLSDCNVCRIDAIQSHSRDLSIPEIAALQDPVLRNYLITATYHRLSHEVAACLGFENANWCTFAAWASEQAGKTIRKENIPLSRLNPLGAVDRIAGHVARGNLRVFAEIAPPFQAFLDLVRDQALETRASIDHALRGGAEAVARLLEERLELDPRQWAAGCEGQEMLVVAFSLYLRAFHEQDPDLRSEYMFVANSHVGLHEQTRLNEDIEAALTVPELDWLLETAGQWRTWLEQSARPLVARLTRPGPVQAGRRAGKALAGRALKDRSPVVLARRGLKVARGWDAMLREGQARSATLGTKLFMALRIGGEELSLGRDIPVRPGAPVFPTHLQTFDNPCGEFRRHLDRVLSFDKTPETLEGSGAADWSSLEDRMNFILDLFRSRQQSPDLFHHPLLHGEVPDACGAHAESSAAA